MNSFIDFKREIDILIEKIQKIQREKNNLIMPIYELLRINEETLGEFSNILPRNLKLISSNVLVLRLKVLEAEVSESVDIDEELKVKVLNVISDAREKVIEKSKEQEIIDNKLNKLNDKLEQRKNYVLEKKDVLDKIASSIDEIKNKIDIRSAYLDENDDLEFGIRLAVQSVIKSYNEKIEELVRQRTDIIQEVGLIDDFKELVSLGVIENILEKQIKDERERVKEAKGEVIDKTLYIDSVNTSDVEGNRKIEDLHIYKDNYAVLPEAGLWSKASNDSSMYKLASDLGVNDDFIGKWVVEADGKYVDTDMMDEFEPESAKVVLPNNTEINDKDGIYMVPNDNLISETFKEEYEVVSSYKSLLLEQMVKFKKNLRVILGLTALAASTSILTTGNVLTGALPLGIVAGSLIDGITNKPESSILRRSYKLEDEAFEMLNNFSLLSNKEKEKLLKASDMVGNQARRVRINRELGRLDYEELSKLDDLNNSLNDLIENVIVSKKELKR